MPLKQNDFNIVKYALTVQCWNMIKKKKIVFSIIVL